MIVRVGLIMPSRLIRTQMFGDVVAGAFAWLCLCLIVFCCFFYIQYIYILQVITRLQPQLCSFKTNLS